MHQLAWSNYQNRKRSISVAGRCITRIERRAESPTYLRERQVDGERERERAEGTRRSQKRSAPPKGAGSPINSLRAATAKCSLYAEIMKITNSPAAYVRARTTCHGPRFESTPSKLSPTRLDQAAPSTYIYIYTYIGNCRPLYFVEGGEGGCGRKRVIAWNTFQVAISRLAADRVPFADSAQLPLALRSPRFSSLSGDKCPGDLIECAEGRVARVDGIARICGQAFAI